MHQPMESYCEDSSGTSPANSSSPPYSATSFRPSDSRCFYVPLHEKDPEKRIAALQDKMAALRKKYMALRAEVIAIDHKRRKARKKAMLLQIPLHNQKMATVTPNRG
ncbi:hypothetical protein CEXT_103911 [Caerostris extrusa]|uniref:Uncharacterized protein n=1 Tax=Caerostris extrusa TaxID=172846 RepID=A0AAV4QC86_CAEEX|nr:hypothetical protein CEXT_103911 [Caerostris extrusa]